VFQAAKVFTGSSENAASWMGSLCVGIGLLTIFFSWRYKAPVLVVWSTAGSVLLATNIQGFTVNEAIGAFLFAAVLTLVFGLTGLFAKVMGKISLALTSGLLAGVLFHFCLDAFSGMQSKPVLVGSMFAAYIVGKKVFPRLSMLMALVVGLLVCYWTGAFQPGTVALTGTRFVWTQPQFTISSLLSLGIPLFVVTMASQNLTGLSVMRSYGYNNPISKLLTGIGFVNIFTSFFGGFSMCLAAITGAIAAGPEAHPNKDKRYVAALIAGFLYLIVGFAAGSLTSVFAIFPAEMISAIAGFALLTTVSSALQTALVSSEEKETAFITFVIAASGLRFFGIGSAFWAIIVGLLIQFIFSARKD
ncbi:MAG: benzoate/H(+) symporter BenE family transporter, partial [Pseudobdellovibrionaceae bacterium]